MDEICHLALVYVEWMRSADIGVDERRGPFIQESNTRGGRGEVFQIRVTFTGFQSIYMVATSA
jgi:hypothetical protein